jgi:hypothetical protein
MDHIRDLQPSEVFVGGNMKQKKPLMVGDRNEWIELGGN